MLTDRYDLLLSTASSSARDDYVLGCEVKLTVYPGAIEAFDRAIATGPGFALPHAARAHALLERGDAVAARESTAAAKSLAAGLPARETSHIAFFGLLVAGDAGAALAALRAHLNAWPRDALLLGTTAFTNGLIGSSGYGRQKRTLLDVLDRLAPHYGEDGDPSAARAFLTSWLTTYPRNGSLYSHLSWHLALSHLEAGDAGAAFQLFREAFAPAVHSGPPRGQLNDAVSFLWRWELAGQPREAAASRMMHDFGNEAYPRAGVAFSDMHVALAQAAAGDDAALAARTRQIDMLEREGRYPSGSLIAAVSRGFAAFEG